VITAELSRAGHFNYHPREKEPAARRAGASHGGGSLTYVIGAACIDVMDRTCVEECPVDCIYEGARSLYIHPDECVDCGACEPVCPVEAIYYEDDLPADQQPYLEDNARFFAEPLPGRDQPLGSPGGAARSGALGVDTELVASHPTAESAT
jgi:NAD-dependent dihydropyrimidine dehydrogenase PreA subunit